MGLGRLVGGGEVSRVGGSGGRLREGWGAGGETGRVVVVGGGCGLGAGWRG